jgi:hypothetical protein
MIRSRETLHPEPIAKGFVKEFRSSVFSRCPGGKPGPIALLHEPFIG